MNFYGASVGEISLCRVTRKDGGFRPKIHLPQRAVRGTVLHSRFPFEPFSPMAKKRAPASGCPFFWWTIKGSNLGPTGYEPVALTN